MSSTLHPFNAGTVKTPATVIGVYLSTDNVLDNSDTLIKTINLKSIAPGRGISVGFSYSGAINYINTPYLIAKFDLNNVAAESDETDNLAIYYPL